MKIFASGIATETNTFSSIPTGLDDFMVQRGRDALQGHVSYPSLDLFVTWGRWAKEHDYEFSFGLMAFAQPFGLTTKAAYESLRDELLDELKAAMPVDIVLLMLHGAMVAHGYDDCEEDIIRRTRAIVGPNAVIGVELDLHCHLSAAKIDAADLVITYKEYPHVDWNDRARELFDLAVKARIGDIRPTMALFDCHMIGLFPTSRKPLREFVNAMTLAEQRQGVLSISFGHGFPFADLPHGGAKMLVVTDNDRALADQVAREMGLEVYRLRRDIGFDSISLTLEQAMSRALSNEKTPVVVADQSDNVGGGAPGDATFALRWLLDRDVAGIAVATFYDPEVVKIARKSGKGTTLPVRLGGKLGPASGNPLDIEVTVLATLDNYMHSFPQTSGEPVLVPAGNVVALRCGGIDIIVSSERCQTVCPSIFSDLGIDPRSKRLLVVKSVQHFYAAFAPIAAEVIYMATAGAVAPDPRRISYRRLDVARLYPWVDDPLGIGH
jgi:microcystin degradation protein MlrC